MIYCLVEVSASQSRRKCFISSVAFGLQISQHVWPSVCLLYVLSLSVPALALNNVVVATELSYKSCSPRIQSLYFLLSINELFFCKSSCHNLSSNSFILLLMC